MCTYRLNCWFWVLKTREVSVQPKRDILGGSGLGREVELDFK